MTICGRGGVTLLACLVAPASAVASAWWIRSPNPSGTPNGQLVAIDCQSAKDCIAVGSATSDGGFSSPLAEGWDGKRWAIQPVPHLPTAPAGSLADVACKEPQACLAVGATIGPAGRADALAEWWNGRGWKVVHTPRGLRALRAVSFFFQAEDGIRDLTVTGVQTCALPI